MKCLIWFILCRVQKLKGQFAHLYVVVILPTKEQNELFVHSYFKWVIWNLCPNWLFGYVTDFKELGFVSLCERYGMELGKPTFVPVEDLEMGFEKIVKIALSRGGKSLFSNDHFNGFFQVVSLSNHMNCSMQTTGCHNKIKGWGQLIRIIYMLYFCAYKFSININNINYYFLQNAPVYMRLSFLVCEEETISAGNGRFPQSAYIHTRHRKSWCKCGNSVPYTKLVQFCCFSPSYLHPCIVLWELQSCNLIGSCKVFYNS